MRISDWSSDVCSSDLYDGILAFGATLAEIYRKSGWDGRTFVWHEAADLHLFRPPEEETERHGVVWIGNWGDDERSAELRNYLLVPCQSTGLDLDIRGVRYPAHALMALRLAGARYHGWIANRSEEHTSELQSLLRIS